MAGNEVIDGLGPSESAKVAFLASSEAHPGAAQVELRETHMAWVFLAGDRVFKMKKPVRYPFLDYATVEARHRVCQDEVRLNRRLAPNVYLGLARLTCDPEGELAINGQGRAVDWLVEMRRLPDALMLDRMILAGKVEPEQIDAVARTLANFFTAGKAAQVDPAAHLQRFARELEIGREVFAKPEFAAVSARAFRITELLENLLDCAPDIVTARVASGRLVDGHGDLKPEHICLNDPPVIIDCLEFSSELRLLDPFHELSYLGMECAVLGADWIGPRLIRHCAEALHDRPSDRLLAFYTAFRGLLRARQSLAHLLEPNPRTPEKWQPLAAHYLDQAEAAALSLRPPRDRPASHPRGGAE